jgi:hypothetical protein
MERIDRGEMPEIRGQPQYVSRCRQGANEPAADAPKRAEQENSLREASAPRLEKPRIVTAVPVPPPELAPVSSGTRASGTDEADAQAAQNLR